MMTSGSKRLLLCPACLLPVEMAQTNEERIINGTRKLSTENGVGCMTVAKTAEVLPGRRAWHLRYSSKPTLRKQRILNYIERYKAEGNHRGLDPNKVTGA